MADKLRESANIKGGVIEGCLLIDSTGVLLAETVERPPSYYRAQAGAGTFKKTYMVARETVDAAGESVVGELRVTAPAITDDPVVQRYVADDGRQRRKSSSESAWTPWRPDVAKAATGWTSAAAGGGGITGGASVGSGVADQVAALINSLIDAGVLDEELI